MHVSAPWGCKYNVRFASGFEKDHKRNNYDVEYRFKKNRKVVETAAIQKEIKKAMKHMPNRHKKHMPIRHRISLTIGRKKRRS